MSELVGDCGGEAKRKRGSGLTLKRAREETSERPNLRKGSARVTARTQATGRLVCLAAISQSQERLRWCFGSYWSSVIIQSEMTDSEGNVWPRLLVYQHLFPFYMQLISESKIWKHFTQEAFFIDTVYLISISSLFWMKRGLTSVTRFKSPSTQTAFNFVAQSTPGFSSQFAKLHFAIGDSQKQGSSPR